MEKQSINLKVNDPFLISFIFLLTTLLYLALWQPLRIRNRTAYRWAWYSLTTALVLEAAPALFLSASGPESMLGDTSMRAYFGALRVIGLLGHILIALGLLLAITSLGLLGEVYDVGKQVEPQFKNPFQEDSREPK